jgi:hypothetical protein
VDGRQLLLRRRHVAGQGGVEREPQPVDHPRHRLPDLEPAGVDRRRLRLPPDRPPGLGSFTSIHASASGRSAQSAVQVITRL